MAITIYGLDSLVIDIAVKVAGSQTPYDLSGCSVDAACDGPGSPIGASSTVIADASTGLIRVTFARGTFKGNSGSYVLQVRVQNGNERQTVAEVPFTVAASIYVTGQDS